jgi:PH (Pleckstrin Homology) domain-containing protein
MAQMDRLLAPGEPVHLVSREHGIVLAGPFLRAGLVLAAAAGAAVLSAGLPAPAAIRLVPVLAAAAVAARALLRLVAAVSRWQRRRLVVTDRRAIFLSGGLGQKAAVVPLEAIGDVEIASTATGRALHYGGIVVCAGGRRGLLFGLRRMPDPDLLLALLLGLAEDDPAPRPRRAPGASGAWSLSIVE